VQHSRLLPASWQSVRKCTNKRNLEALGTYLEANQNTYVHLIEQTVQWSRTAHFQSRSLRTNASLLMLMVDQSINYRDCKSRISFRIDLLITMIHRLSKVEAMF
jgi:hypothetical protein